MGCCQSTEAKPVQNKPRKDLVASHNSTINNNILDGGKLATPSAADDRNKSLSQSKERSMIIVSLSKGSVGTRGSMELEELQHGLSPCVSEGDSGAAHYDVYRPPPGNPQAATLNGTKTSSLGKDDTNGTATEGGPEDAEEKFNKGGLAGLGYPELPEFPLVKKTWDIVRERYGSAEAGFGWQFFKDLFKNNPIVHLTVFKDTPIAQQQLDLVRWLDANLDLLFKHTPDSLRALCDAIDILGANHILYGVEAKHYGPVAASFLRTFQNMLLEEFTSDAFEQWKIVLTFVATRMITIQETPLGIPYRARFIKKRISEVRSVFDRYQKPFNALAFAGKVLAVFDNEHSYTGANSAVQKFANCLSSATINQVLQHSTVYPIYRAGQIAGDDHFFSMFLGIHPDAPQKEVAFESNQNANLDVKLGGVLLTVLELKTGKLAFFEKYAIEWYLSHVLNGINNNYDEKIYAENTVSRGKGSAGAVHADAESTKYPLVVRSWKRITEIGEREPNKAFGTAFYRNLFLAAPELQRTFFRTTTMSDQRVTFEKALDGIISWLHDQKAATCIIRALGVRHVVYGVQDKHFDLFGKVIIKTMKEMITVDNATRKNNSASASGGSKISDEGTFFTWTDEAESQWKDFYSFFETTMIAATHSPAAQGMRRRINKDRLAEFEKVVNLFCAPFEPHQFACRLCTIACGHQVDEGHPFATALTPVFASSFLEARSTQSMDPIVEAAHKTVTEGEAFADWINENLSAFNGDDPKRVAKEKLASAIKAVVQQCADEHGGLGNHGFNRSTDSLQGLGGGSSTGQSKLTAFDDLVLDFFVENGFRKGLFFDEEATASP